MSTPTLRAAKGTRRSKSSRLRKEKKKYAVIHSKTGQKMGKISFFRLLRDAKARKKQLEKLGYNVWIGKE